MIIRKKYNVESAHIVRNCTSQRCSHSIHGHSAVIEVFLESRSLDNAQMVYDFGLMKGTIKQFIDGMDHCYLLCERDNKEFRDFIKVNCDRWIELPCNPSAEMLSVFLFNYIEQILSLTKMNNGEHDVHVKSVRYHETETGYAECDKTDAENLWNPSWEVEFSTGVVRDFDEELRRVLVGQFVENPSIQQQINLDFKQILKSED